MKIRLCATINAIDSVLLRGMGSLALLLPALAFAPATRSVAHAQDFVSTVNFDQATKDTLKKKINVDFRNYRILGACNPTLAYEALQLDDKVGTMLPCNVVVQDLGGGNVEIAAIDPVASMQAIENPELKDAAGKVQAKLRKVIENL